MPRWLFAPIAGAAVEVQALETDTGVVQIDSLTLDEEETARQAARFFAGFDRRVAIEAALIRGVGANLVVGDIPPLACAAAARRRPVGGARQLHLGLDLQHLPGVRAGRAGRDAGDPPRLRRRHPRAPPAAPRRFPADGGRHARHPFIARRSTRDPADTRRRLRIAGDRPVLLPSFGGDGVNLPLEALRRSERFTIIEPVREPPDGLLYQDLVAAADVVVSKPGYGIVSECLANGTALLYTSRGRFVEHDLFVEQMPRILRCRYLSQEDLLAGHWAEAIEVLLAQPAAPDVPAVNGAASPTERS